MAMLCATNRTYFIYFLRQLIHTPPSLYDILEANELYKHVMWCFYYKMLKGILYGGIEEDPVPSRSPAIFLAFDTTHSLHTRRGVECKHKYETSLTTSISKERTWRKQLERTVHSETLHNAISTSSTHLNNLIMQWFSHYKMVLSTCMFVMEGNDHYEPSS